MELCRAQGSISIPEKEEEMVEHSRRNKYVTPEHGLQEQKTI
jgi:hypothetical protein